MLDSTKCREDYEGDNSTATYDYGFKVFSSSHLSLVLREIATGIETDLTIDDDYTVDDVGEESGGTITLVDDGQAWIDSNGYLDSAYVLTIRRVLPLTQLTDFRNQGSSYRETIENMLDMLVMVAQQLDEKVGRSIRLKTTEQASDYVLNLPDETNRASKALTFTSEGDVTAT